MKNDKTQPQPIRQNENNADLTEEELSRLLHEAYKDEIPVLSEMLVQRTLEEVQKAEKEKKEQMGLQRSAIKFFTGNVWFKRCFTVATACILLVICGTILQESNLSVKKEAAIEQDKAESNGSTGTQGMDYLADEEWSVESESARPIENAAAERGDTITEENSMPSTLKDDMDGEVVAEMEESEMIVLADILPLFPKELRGKEVKYELWIDGTQAADGWETLVAQALQKAPPQLLTEESAVDHGALEQEILFTLLVYTEDVEYCLEAGVKTCVTVEAAGEKRSTFFEILDLTLYEEILTMKP